MALQYRYSMVKVPLPCFVSVFSVIWSEEIRPRDALWFSASERGLIFSIHQEATKWSSTTTSCQRTISYVYCWYIQRGQC